jgi:hypothetical protein
MTLLQFKHSHLRTKPFLLLLVTLLTCSSVAAQSAEEKGLAIAKERKARDVGWSDSIADTSMILRNPRGEETERKMRVKSLEVREDGDKGLTIFDQPLDVKGTAFLNFSHPLEADDQWMYLPKLKKVKRIQSKNKSGPFMGSEFAFEDMSSFEIEKFSFKYLRSEQYQGIECFVVEQVPLEEDSGYSKNITWVDKEHYRAFKVEYYDRKDSLLKILTMHNYQLYLDKYWRPMELRMDNRQNGKSTDLITHSLEFKTGLLDNDFDKDSLMRAR